MTETELKPLSSAVLAISASVLEEAARAARPG